MGGDLNPTHTYALKGHTMNKTKINCGITFNILILALVSGFISPVINVKFYFFISTHTLLHWVVDDE